MNNKVDYMHVKVRGVLGMKRMHNLDYVELFTRYGFVMFLVAVIVHLVWQS